MTDEELYKKALEQFEQSSSYDKEQRELAIEDALFVHSEDGQWGEDAIEKRRDRPRYTINRIAGSVDQIVGDQRQNSIGVKVSPKGGGDEKLARIYTGLIRSIEQASKAGNAYDSAFDETVTGGYGGWRIRTDYEADDSFEQEILIEAIDSAASSLFFSPACKTYDKRDSPFGFLVSQMQLADFKDEYPEASETDFKSEGFNKDWVNGDSIRIAEYWYKEPYKKTLGLLSDGRVIDLKEEKAVLDELAAQEITVVKTRVVDSFKVKMRHMNGAEFLTEPQEWPSGKYIPLVPVFGRTTTIDGEKFIRGIVRMAKDPQRIYNYATSAAVEATALTPKDPYWITPTQAAGYEDKLKAFNTANSPFMMYNADPQAPGSPQRSGAPTLQNALLQQVNQAGMDIYSTTGLEPASMGNSPELKSGKAIKAQQAMGDRGAFVFQDNLAKSVAYTGEILVDLIPRIYDTERVVKTIGADEAPEDVTINQAEFNEINQPIIDDETGKQVIVNDLSQGKYSVSVASGQSFSSKKEETVNQLVMLAGQSPVIQELALDLIIDNMDLNKGEEIKARIRKMMIDKKIVKPTDEEVKELGLDQKPPEDPMDSALIKNLAAQTESLQIKSEETIAKVHNLDADTQAKIMKTQKDSVDALTGLMDAFMKKLDARLPISEQEAELIQGQTALVAETQIDVIEGQEVAGSAPLAAKGQQMQAPQEPVQQGPPILPPEGNGQFG